MNEQEIDRRSSRAARRPEPEPDPAFVDRVVLAARLESQFRIARRRALLRAVVDCGAAVAVGASFF